MHSHDQLLLSLPHLHSYSHPHCYDEICYTYLNRIVPNRVHILADSSTNILLPLALALALALPLSLLTLSLLFSFLPFPLSLPLLLLKCAIFT